VVAAPSFQYSWDQAMTPQVANVMLANLAQVFALTQSPSKFVSTLNATAATGS
jgi:raffinose/stachyose/melibiose transport system substrate-binding protein